VAHLLKTPTVSTDVVAVVADPRHREEVALVVVAAAAT
jgi:hypothetical protein